MKRNRLLNYFVVRNGLGLLALLAAHYLTDVYAINQRPGFSKVSPYLYMNFILHTEFSISRSLPYLVNFWVYTVTGLGVYVTYRYLHTHQQAVTPSIPATSVVTDESGYFSCVVDGDRQRIPYVDIQYIESLENYLKIITKSKTYVTRLTLKEAEERLPKRQFVRISRSYIVNRTHIDNIQADAVWIGQKELRIGKVYKRYVAGQFAGE